MNRIRRLVVFDPTNAEVDSIGITDTGIEHEFSVKLPEEKQLIALIAMVEEWVAKGKEVFQVCL